MFLGLEHERLYDAEAPGRYGTWASSNASRNVFSDSPDIPETIDGAEMLMNGTPSSCSFSITLVRNNYIARQKTHTPAIAWANKVLPHPGGP